ncbi:hypothetical protein SAMN06265371_104255 [Lutibacter agarilyticus]|uniref:Outer membrane protein beta-barrel domain-containing protein n=1 Tax=Lutibacter agarilyticus TaxID=1109740 RepID=A0A238X180_9FLAO|nr:hypothetical protein [Lutibacter agarilyticus]SNR52214.1 hypothetical protein SAMN06265371_104255 [Lutibacter agarilyticus]
MKNFKLLLGVLLISTTLFAQHSEEELENNSHNEGTHTVSHGKNMIAIDYGIDHIKEGVKHGDAIDEEGHWVSSIGIDYFRGISEKWGVGVKFDIQLGHYIIPHKENLERENAFIALAVGSYKILPKWGVFAGAGVEFEKNENLGVIRVGTEYLFHLKHGWAIPVGFFWDIKEGYDVYAFTVGIAKHF